MSLGMAQRHGPFRYVVLSLVLVLGLVTSVAGQALQQSPYGGTDRMRNGGLDLVPSNPLGFPGSTGGLPRGSDSVYLSSGMFRDILPLIPNLEIGYLYSFGNHFSTGRLTLDYLQPIRLGSDSAFFVEAHGESTDILNAVSLWWRGQIKPTNFNLPYLNLTETTHIYFNEQTDLSIGGGYRKIFNESTLLGINGFYDANVLGNSLYQSGGVGIEFAALLPGNGVSYLSFNWYGIPLKGAPFTEEVRQGPRFHDFQTDFFQELRRGPRDYDFQVGYSHELYEGGPGLRLHATGYKFCAANAVYGGRGGAELKSRDGVNSFKYEVGHDKVNHTYHTVGAFVNVGIRLSNLLSGESPFEAPTPIFRSPRNFTNRLADPVKRAFGGLSASRGRNTSWMTCLCGIEDASLALVTEWAMTPGRMADGSSTACDSTPSYTFTNRTALFFCTEEVVPSGSLYFNIASQNGCAGAFPIPVHSGWCNTAFVIPGFSLQSWSVRNSTGGDFDPGTVRLRVYRY